MRMVAFRVQNYKCINDTGWIDCEPVTAFVGKNESGKSALFRGLSKLNPTDEEPYDGLKEFPRRRYTEEFENRDWPVASAKFELSEDDRATLCEQCSLLPETTMVTTTRSYSGSLTVVFEPEPELPDTSAKQWHQVLNCVLGNLREVVAANGHGEAWAPTKEALMTYLSELVESDEGNERHVPEEEVNEVRNHVHGKVTEEWHKALVSPLLEPLEEFCSSIVTRDALAQAKALAADLMPHFLYFAEYDVLDSAVYLPEFVVQMGQEEALARRRVTRCLFDHVRLDPTEVLELGRYDPDLQQASDDVREKLDERFIKLSSASHSMTEKFSEWWGQRRHEFEYQADAEYFRVWVSDNLDDSRIELDQRSTGMQYFFSFYLVFLVEAERRHRDCILLLDEPGLHFHPTAQLELVGFFDRVSEDNQILYTTHSPFMVDGSRLHRARAVYEEADGTTAVSSDVWPSDRDTLYPLQAALGYSLCQALFISERQLIVEGATDYQLLHAGSRAFQAVGLMGIRDDVILVSAAGLKNVAPLASMLVGHDVEVVILFDSDKQSSKGKAVASTIQKLADLSPNCLILGDLVDKEGVELEDLMPEEYYLSAVSEAYGGIDISLSAEESMLPNVTDKVKAFFERECIKKLEKWRPINVIVRRFETDPNGIPDELKENLQKVFQAVNAAFGAAAG